MKDNEEFELKPVIDKYSIEGSKLVVNAFQEGYLLGIQYARKLLEEEENENKS